MTGTVPSQVWAQQSGAHPRASNFTQGVITSLGCGWMGWTCWLSRLPLHLHASLCWNGALLYWKWYVLCGYLLGKAICTPGTNCRPQLQGHNCNCIAGNATVMCLQAFHAMPTWCELVLCRHGSGCVSSVCASCVWPHKVFVLSKGPILAGHLPLPWAQHQ